MKATPLTITHNCGVENGLHWALDVTFKKDACRVRTSHAPQNQALLQRIALTAFVKRLVLLKE